MQRSRPADLAPLLNYLNDIGFGELYLPAGSPERGAEAIPLRDQAAGRELAAAAGAAPGPTPRPSPAPQSAAPSSAADSDGGLFSPVPSELERITVLSSLAELVEGCTRCRLAEGRCKVVFGSGSPNADLMFIGEGPGAEEDRQGLPFVGPAGELLSKIIAAIGLSREQCYIANIVKCRPPGNRDPLPDEVAECRGYLERQIDLIEPKVIVALGRVAAQTLLATDQPLGRLRGAWHRVRGVPTRVTYHPAALLRNASWKRPTWEDMQLVRDRLREP